MLIQQLAALSRPSRHSHRLFLGLRMVFSSRFFSSNLTKKAEVFSHYCLLRFYHWSSFDWVETNANVNNDISAGVERKIAKYWTIKWKRTSQETKSNERKCDIDSDNTTTIVLVKVFGTQPPNFFPHCNLFNAIDIYSNSKQYYTNLLGFTEQLSNEHFRCAEINVRSISIERK